MSLITVVYLVVGAIVATQHHFFANLGTLKLVASALLALLLWPIVSVEPTGPAAEMHLT
jgi:hypothetical protein